MNRLDHQDWDPVLLKNKMNSLTDKDRRKKGQAPKVASRSEAQQRLSKIARTEVGAVPKTSTEMSRTITKARLALKLTQKQLAQKANIKPDEVNKLERPNQPVNMSIVSKVERALNIQVRGMIKRDS